MLLMYILVSSVSTFSSWDYFGALQTEMTWCKTLDELQGSQRTQDKNIKTIIFMDVFCPTRDKTKHKLMLNSL